jgi:hypothetical protein
MISDIKIVVLLVCIVLNSVAIIFAVRNYIKSNKVYDEMDSTLKKIIPKYGGGND